MGDDLTTTLVTGASGYLGSRVLRLLRARGVEAIGVARSTHPGLLACDLADPRAASELLRSVQPTAIVHCAAVVPRHAEEYADAGNAEASLRMVETALQLKPKRFIFASSMSVYPDGVLTAREEDATPSGNVYAARKLEAESLLLGHSSMSVSILRLPGLFGPPRRGGVLFNAALAFTKGQPFRLLEPVPRWSALHVDDAAGVMVRALELPRATHVMNVGYPGRMAVADAVAQLARMFERVWAAPVPVWFEFDLSRLHRLLGPVGSSFAVRLREIASWAREVALETVDD